MRRSSVSGVSLLLYCETETISRMPLSCAARATFSSRTWSIAGRTEARPGAQKMLTRSVSNPASRARSTFALASAGSTTSGAFSTAPMNIDELACATPGPARTASTQTRRTMRRPALTRDRLDAIL
jgi:hypothetical protein